MSSLRKAVGRGDLQAVKRALKDRSSDIDRSEAFFDAVVAGEQEIVGLLLDAGVDVNARARESSRWTALLFAIEHDHLALVQYLLEQGADPNFRDEQGNTPLSVAISHEWEVAERAATAPRTTFSERLVSAGADCNARGVGERTALDLAIEMGHSTGEHLLRASGGLRSCELTET